MNIDGWWIRDNTFTKCFMDYVVRVEESTLPIEDIGIGKVDVTVWKGNGYENTEHTKTFDNFEEAFKFVEEFSKQKLFDKAVEDYFGGPFCKTVKEDS